MKKVLSYPAPSLLTPSEEVVDFGPSLITLIEDLVNTMNFYSGLGLAAPQIGINKNIFVISANVAQNPDIPLGATKVFINPNIIEVSSDKSVFTEGCLSFKDIYQIIKRPNMIKLSYYDENNKHYVETFDGISSRIIQHEYEHLNGETFLKHISRLKKDIVIRKLKKHQ